MDFRRQFSAGDVVFSQGDPGDFAYVVESGRVVIEAGPTSEKVVLAERVPGEFFGEMAIIDDQPRSACARAVEDTVLLAISRAQLTQRIERTDPILRMCITVLLDHVRGSLRRLADPNDTAERDRRQQLPPEARQEALAAIQLEQELRRALDRDELELWYQPLIAFDSGEIAGFEALMRWRHPERGLVPPGLFIPTAERSGLIVDMSQWALRSACLDLKRFQQAGLAAPAFMSVNFSGKDFARPDFLELVDKTLLETGTDARHIKLEITETLLMHSPDTARRVLNAVRDRGTSIAIDDFGTGYSSLSYLQSLPADTLKIDQSFISAMMDDRSSLGLVKSIVGLGRGLDMKIIAEGIEDREQARALRDLGVDLGQGYLFSRPKPSLEVVDLLATWAGWDFT
jgi:diguanylate cyclase